MGHTRFDEVCDEITDLFQKIEVIDMIRDPTHTDLQNAEDYRARMQRLIAEKDSLKGKRDVRRPED